MIQQQTNNYIKICIKSWLLCESCIYNEINSFSPRPELIELCTECAKSCFAVVTRLVSNSDDLEYLPFNCLLDCLQCANACRKYPELDLQDCADVFLMCAFEMKNLTVFSPN